jgi:hypothetical protein
VLKVVIVSGPTTAGPDPRVLGSSRGVAHPEIATQANGGSFSGRATTGGAAHAGDPSADDSGVPSPLADLPFWNVGRTRRTSVAVVRSAAQEDGDAVQGL